MSIFYKKLKCYIDKIKTINKDTPYFNYDKNTNISPEIAMELYQLYFQKSTLERLLEKEQNYNRLLEQENNMLNGIVAECEFVLVDNIENDEEELDIIFDRGCNENLLS